MSSEPSTSEDAGSEERCAEVRAARAAKDKSYSAPVQAALGCASLRAAARLPFAALHHVGTLAGQAMLRCPTRERRATRVNLELCFPELSPQERASFAQRSLVETGRTMAELAALWCWPAARALELVREVRGAEQVDAALTHGGVLMLTPHLGAWELAGLYTASRFPLTALYKPPRIREMEAFYTGARERSGAKLVPADMRGVRALHCALRSHEVAGVLPDQDPGRGAGIFVPFFGVRANTTTLIAKLLQKHDVPLFLTWCERLPGAEGFRMHYVEAADPELRHRDVETAVHAMNRAIERLIRTAPQQYLWSYKRFRTRPAGQLDPYCHGAQACRLGRREA